MNPGDFRLTDENWATVAVELKAAALDLLAREMAEGIVRPDGSAPKLREPSEGDRRDLELLCGMFVAHRLQHKNQRPRPAAYADAWSAVGAAAKRLHDAINHLDKTTGAAKFGVIDNFGQASAEFRKMVPEVRDFAKYMAKIERLAPTPARNEDPMADWLANALRRFFIARGGSEGTSEGGPLSRFLKATYGQAMAAAGEKPPKEGARRARLRKVTG